MIYFIDRNQIYSGKLLDLRDKIFKNTIVLIELFRERKRLAAEIGIIKRKIDLDIRDSERENAVLDSLSELNHIEKRLMNIIFEISVSGQYPEENIPDLSFMNSERGQIEIAGNFETLYLIVGLLSSSPGLEVVAKDEVPHPLYLTMRLRGAHLKNRIEGKVDYKICLNGGGSECAVEILPEKVMFLKREFFMKAISAKRVEVTRF